MKDFELRRISWIIGVDPVQSGLNEREAGGRSPDDRLTEARGE